MSPKRLKGEGRLAHWQGEAASFDANRYLIEDKIV